MRCRWEILRKKEEKKKEKNVEERRNSPEIKGKSESKSTKNTQERERWKTEEGNAFFALQKVVYTPIYTYTGIASVVHDAVRGKLLEALILSAWNMQRAVEFWNILTSCRYRRKLKNYRNNAGYT